MAQQDNLSPYKEVGLSSRRSRGHYRYKKQCKDWLHGTSNASKLTIKKLGLEGW